MPERGAQASEKFNPHERYGLTSDHWQFIAKLIGKPKNDIEEKIIAYGQKVISGEFQDTEFQHRRFLGERHWRSIYILLINWPPIFHTDKVIARKLEFFIDRELHATYSLNDYIDSRINELKSGIYLGTFESGRYVDGEKADQEYRTLSWDESSRKWNLKIEAVIEVYRGYTKSAKFTIDADEQSILNTFLLTPDEVGDPKEKSPYELQGVLFDLAKKHAEDVRSRLVNRVGARSRLVNRDMFGLLENEI